MTALELIRIAKALKVRVTVFLGQEIFISKKEIKIIQAFRELAFDDYKRLLNTLEAQIYFSSKDTEGERKEYLENLVKYLSEMSLEGKRPKGREYKKIENQTQKNK